MRLILSDPDLHTFFDTKDTFQAINEICSTKNSIKKSEKKHFAYSHVANLLTFYMNSSILTLADVKQNLDFFVADIHDSLYFVAGFLSCLRRTHLPKDRIERVHTLVQDLSSKKVTADTYRQATYLLALQNACKILKFKIDNAKYEALENQCAGLVSTKSLSKYFNEIVADDNQNSKLQVPFFEETISNILHRSNEKAIGKLFKFFHSVMESVMKDKNLRQKKAFHLMNFLRAFIEEVDLQVLLSMDLDQSLSRVRTGGESVDASTIADIFVDLISFWIRQFGNKSPESKKAATEVDHALAEKLKQTDKQSSFKLAIFLLKILKHQPTNSLRGGDLKLMSALLGLLYQDEPTFNQYFNFLLQKVKSSSTISELNFFLNELEHLGQISLSAKHHKEIDNEREASLRCAVLKSLIDVYLHCESEKNLQEYFNRECKLDWNDQELSFRKFRTKVFERILNLVFKREDNLLLTKAASLFAAEVGKRHEDTQAFCKMLIESADKVAKNQEVFGSLHRALVFQNIFEEDVSKNADIVADIVTSSQLMSAKRGREKNSTQEGKNRMTTGADDQLPEDVFVDSLIALCSTSHPQTKHVVNRSLEAVADRLSKVGFSLLAQAIVREDSKYLQEDGEADADDAEVGEEGEDEVGIEEEEVDESADSELDDEEGMLGKRQPQKNGHGSQIDNAVSSKPQKNKKQLGH